MSVCAAAFATHIVSSLFLISAAKVAEGDATWLQSEKSRTVRVILDFQHPFLPFQVFLVQQGEGTEQVLMKSPGWQV